MKHTDRQSGTSLTPNTQKTQSIKSTRHTPTNSQNPPTTSQITDNQKVDQEHANHPPLPPATLLYSSAFSKGGDGTRHPPFLHFLKLELEYIQRRRHPLGGPKRGSRATGTSKNACMYACVQLCIGTRCCGPLLFCTQK